MKQFCQYLDIDSWRSEAETIGYNYSIGEVVILPLKQQMRFEKTLNPKRSGGRAEGWGRKPLP